MIKVGKPGIMMFRIDGENVTDFSCKQDGNSKHTITGYFFSQKDETIFAASNLNVELKTKVRGWITRSFHQMVCDRLLNQTNSTKCTEKISSRTHHKSSISPRFLTLNRCLKHST